MNDSFQFPDKIFDRRCKKEGLHFRILLAKPAQNEAPKMDIGKGWQNLCKKQRQGLWIISH